MDEFKLVRDTLLENRRGVYGTSLTASTFPSRRPLAV
jgi:hypothetical protein